MARKFSPQQQSDATFAAGDTIQRVQSIATDGTVGAVASAHGITTTGSDRKTVTTAATAVVCPTHTAKWVIFTALSSNTQQVNVGDSTVLAASGSSVGIPLQPGDSTERLPCTNTNQFYVDSRVNGEGVALQYFN